MKFRTDHIRESALQLEFLEQPDSFPVLAAISASGECSFCGPVAVNISAERELNHYRVAGRVRTRIMLDCSRCLAGFEQEIDSSFTIIFRQHEKNAQEDEDEVELDEQDLVSATFSGDEIDLLHEIEEQVALAVPLKPVCSFNCKGLCPSCGSDMNTEPCNCTVKPENLKFAALKDFKVRS